MTIHEIATEVATRAYEEYKRQRLFEVETRIVTGAGPKMRLRRDEWIALTAATLVHSPEFVERVADLTDG